MKIQELILFLFVLKLSEGERENCGKFEVLEFQGGKEVPSSKWPWSAAFVERKTNSFFCGGSLISVNHVLSGEKCK